jgi:hypothetical protein
VPLFSRLQIGLSLPGLRWLLCAVIAAAAPTAPAQEGTGTGTGTGTGSGASSTGGGASSSFGSPAPSTGGTPSTGTTLPGTPPGGRDPSSLLSDSPFTGSNAPSFRTGGPTPANGAGAASSFGAGETEGPTQLRQAPTSFSVPGFYGRGPQQYTVGEGRLARPRFRTTLNVSQGYDDNVFQTPTNAPGTPDQEIRVLVRPATRSSIQYVTVPSGDPLVPDEVVAVEVSGQKAKFQTTRIPGIPAPEREGSWVTRTELGFDVQFASRRSLFTFDLTAGNSYYWNRTGTKADNTASLALVYLYKLSGRTQFTMAVNTSYQSQPDFSVPNQPTSNNLGSYIPLNAKADLSYRLTPRFSGVASVSYNGIYYIETTEQTGNYTETTFGTELRYLFSPRLTLLGELRYSSQVHKNNSALDTNTTYLLAGGELTLTRRFTATLRLGEALQTFTENGDAQSSPYGEATLSYRLSRGTTISWNGRYGFEIAGTADSRLLVGRTGLQLSHIFSPRLQGSLSLNLSHSVTETTSDVVVGAAEPATTTTSAPAPAVIDPATTPVASAPPPEPVEPEEPEEPRTRRVTTELVQDTLDASLSFQYILSRRWTLSLNYSYTMVVGPEDTSDYYRQRVFLGAEYQF